jgi:hypothetical protein
MHTPIATFLLLALATPWAQEPVRPPSPYKIQEGYPVDVIQRYKNRSFSLRQGVGASEFQATQSVIQVSQVWTRREQPITAAFLGGSTELRTQIVATVQAWSESSGVAFDFGPAGSLREWSRQDQTYKAEVRISFDEVGYWSFVGAESVDPSLTASNQPSMNFQQFDKGLPPDWQGVVLHEFGHALGFQHEHQSPNAHCDSEFRWEDDAKYVKQTNIYGSYVPDSSGRRPGIYTVLGGPPNNWSRSQIDFNLKSLPATIDLRFSAFDPRSVMMYSFQSWMFVDANSACQIQENVQLSDEDKRAAAASYQVDAMAPLQSLQALRTLAKQKKLPEDLKEHLSKRLSMVQ